MTDRFCEAYKAMLLKEGLEGGAPPIAGIFSSSQSATTSLPPCLRKEPKKIMSVVPIDKRERLPAEAKPYMPAGFTRPAVNASRFDTLYKPLWEESTFAIKIQDNRLTDDERALIAKIGKRIYGGTT